MASPSPARKKGGKKKKVLTPEQLEQIMDTWKNEPEGEFQYIMAVNQIVSKLNLLELDQMDPDMTVKTQEFLDVYGKMGQVFKVKKCRKIKPIQ